MAQSMNHHIAVGFAADQRYVFDLQDVDTAGMTWEEAQAWIDEEYVKTAYEAAHPVGTTPLADKLLRVAAAYGPRPFASNTAWARRFARCAGKALGMVAITLDVANQSLRFGGVAPSAASQSSRTSAHEHE